MNIKIQNQALYRSIEYCRVDGCLQKYSHTTEAHVCNICNIRAQSCSCKNVLYNITCPTCKQITDIDLNFELYTGSQCIICMEDKKMIVFKECKHANTCIDCAKQL